MPVEIIDAATAEALNGVKTAIQRAYERGLADGRAAFANEVARLAQGISAPEHENTPQAIAVVYAAPEAETEKKKRARRGSVGEAIDKAYAVDGVSALTYQQIYDRVQALGYEDIAISSIRGEMRRRKDRDEAVEIGGNWLLAGKETASTKSMEEAV